MPEKISAPRGTVDILPEQSWKWQTVEWIARETAALYHFSEIRTPVFEHTELFHRGVGESTDIVTKETYTFDDRHTPPRSLTLRPEGTAGVVRAMIESGALNNEGARAKVFYIAPNFRYETVQVARLRQHHQFGVEAFGIADPEQDVECILLQLDFYRRCGLKDMKLRVNSLGDRESKQSYRDALVRLLTPLAGTLSEDSQRRLKSNPLRILDSKDSGDIKALRAIPLPASFEVLSTKSLQHWNRFFELLQTSAKTFGIVPQPDGTLVRGFDYYTDTLWEITASGLGAQNAIGGGGRYDNLVEQLGGRPTPGVGFGSGIERLLLALENQGVELPRSQPKLIWLVSHGEAAKEANWKLMLELRRSGLVCDMDLAGRSVKAQFKLADREHAAYCLVTGDTELAAGTIVVKDLATGEQASVPRDKVAQKLT